MKYLITERQYRLLNEEPKEVFKISFKIFNNNWEFFQEYLEMIGNPPYIIIDNLDLRKTQIFDLGNLIGVEGNLTLRGTPIHSLGDLQFVGGIFDVVDTRYLKSLGKLRVVGKTCIIKNSMVNDLGELETVGRTLNIYGSNVKSLGKVKFVGRDLIGDPNLDGNGKMLEQLKNIEIGGDHYYF